MRKLSFLLFLLSSFFSGLSQTTDATGKKQGYWKKTDDKGKLIYEGTFKDDRPVGTFRFYHPNDTIQAVFNYRNNGKIATVKLFHSNGKRMGEGRYLNEYKGKEMERIKDSVWIIYDEAGALISKDTYVNGKKNGTSYVYLPDGTLAEERNYKMDVQHGPFKQYFVGKRLKGEGNYVNGNLEGRAAYYYPNGVEVAAGYYKNGAKNGPWVYKDEKGGIKEKELYKNGKLATAKETEEFFSKNKPKTTPSDSKGNAPKKPGNGKPAGKTGAK